MAGKKEQFILGLEVSERGIKLVQRNQTKNEIDLVHADAVLTGSLVDLNGHQKPLKDAVKFCRKTIQSRKTVFSLPSQAVLLRQMQLDPALGSLEPQIQWEMEQQTIGRGDAQALDWTQIDGIQTAGETESKQEDELPKEEGEEEDAVAPEPYSPLRYLVAATDRQFLASFTTVLKKAGLDPAIAEVDSCALFNLFLVGYPEEQAGLSLLVDITPERVVLVLARDGRFLDSECILGLNWGKGEPASDSTKKLRTKLLNLLEFQGVPESEVRLFLSGEIAADPKVRDIVTAEIGLPNEIMDPFRAVPASEKIGTQASLIGAALAVAIGLTLRGDE